jgi:hypothetical protein
MSLAADEALRAAAEASDMIAAKANLIRHLESPRPGRVLLVVDSADMVFATLSLHNALAEILHRAGANVCVLLAARSPCYTELHNFKVVNYELPELPPLEAAHLFLKRVHRPLTLRDLGDGESELPIVIAKENRRTVLEKLASHPVMQDLAGHPQKVRDTACKVTPELASLWHLHGALGDTAETMDVEAAIEEPMTTRLDLADAVQEEADGEQTHDPEMAATVLADQEFAQLLSFGFSAEQAHNVLMLKNWGFATELCAQAVRTCNTYEDALQSLVRDAYGFSSEQGSSFVQLTTMGFPADSAAQAVCTFGTLDEALESLVAVPGGRG